MKDKSRTARSSRPRSKPRESGPRERKLKAVSVLSDVREPRDGSPHAPAQPTASLAIVPPLSPPPHATKGGEGGALQPVESSRPAANLDARVQPAPDAGAQPAPVPDYP